METEPHGPGVGGELLLLGLGKLDGVFEPDAELSIFLAEGLILLNELLPRRATGVLGRDSLKDFATMIVDSLAAAMGLLGLLGDGPVGTGKARRGVGDPGNQRYGAHGWSTFLRAGSVTIPTFRNHHPFLSSRAGKIVPTVNLTKADSTGFGTMPLCF
jgi:hypothetical protein